MEAFTPSKAALGNAVLLTHPRTDVPLALTCDASDRAVGEVLEEYVNESWQPLVFFQQEITSTGIKNIAPSTKSS